MPLLPSQLRALNDKRVKHQDRIALFMDMRLGKTRTSIRWRTRHHPEALTLVVTANEAIHGWKTQVVQEGYRTHIVQTPHDSERILMAYDSGIRIFITNWESLIRYDGKRYASPTNIVKDIPWSCVILDESTRIKNPQAKVTKVVQKYLSSASYKAILSGLPNPNGYLDFFEQLKFLYGSFLGCGSWYQFREKFYNEIWDHNWCLKKDARTKIRNAIRARCFILTAEDAGMANQIIRKTFFCTLPNDVKVAYKRTEDQWTNEYDEQTKWILVVRQWLLRYASGTGQGKLHKVKFLQEHILPEVGYADERIVIWCRYNDEITGLANRLSMPTWTIHGGVPQRTRIKRIRAWSKRQGQCALICQVRALRFGVDLSAGSVAIYHTQIDSLEDRQQTEKRLQGPKQTKPVLIVDMPTKGTVEEDIYYAMQDRDIEARVVLSRAYDRFRARFKRKQT